jgi:hypothetical protein
MCVTVVIIVFKCSNSQDILCGCIGLVMNLLINHSLLCLLLIMTITLLSFVALLAMTITQLSFVGDDHYPIVFCWR